MLELARAAGALVVRATREPEDQPTGTSLVGTDDLDALSNALARIEVGRDPLAPGAPRPGTAPRILGDSQDRG